MAEQNEKRYLIDVKQLMAEWDWELNEAQALDPRKLTHGSTKCANWICGKGHNFIARIDHRTIMHSNCPYCAGKRPIIGQNDLATTHPDLLSEWDYDANPQSPSHYLAGSNAKVGWICKDCGHRWRTQIIHRALRNTNCPNCAFVQRGRSKTQHALLKSGSLAANFPGLRLQWDDEKNKHILPSEVHGNSQTKVWWKCKLGHSWIATVANRVAGNGCPICAGKVVLTGFNDLKSKFPEIAAQWHPTRNGQLTPNQITAHNDQKVWWHCPTCQQDYFTSIYSRTSLKTGCPICSDKSVIPGINDLATTHPAIAQEWNYEKNNGLTPQEFVAGSNKKFWWQCKENHEWKASICARTRGSNCPICAKDFRVLSRQKTYLVKSGSLKSRYPSIASQWHPTKNDALTPEDITPGSDKKAWWQCEKGHEWHAVISSRVAGRNCPYCKNEHSTSFPEQAIYYYFSQATPSINRYKHDGKELDIFLPILKIGIEYNGRYYHKNRKQQDQAKKDFFLEKGIRVITIHEGDKSCCVGDDVYYQYVNSNYPNFNALITQLFHLCNLPAPSTDIHKDRSKIFEQYILSEKENSLAAKVPIAIVEWDYERNANLTPWQVSYGSNKIIAWKCSRCGYRWEAVAYTRQKSGCPCCANRVIVPGINDLLTTQPQLANEWDYQKNETLPTQFTARSHTYAWWICKHGHSWRTQIKTRTSGCGCPACAKKNK